MFLSFLSFHLSLAVQMSETYGDLNDSNLLHDQYSLSSSVESLLATITASDINDDVEEEHGNLLSDDFNNFDITDIPCTSLSTNSGVHCGQCVVTISLSRVTALLRYHACAPCFLSFYPSRSRGRKLEAS